MTQPAAEEGGFDMEASPEAMGHNAEQMASRYSQSQQKEVVTY
jgi:hypothetical protein